MKDFLSLLIKAIIANSVIPIVVNVRVWQHIALNVYRVIFCLLEIIIAKPVTVIVKHAVFQQQVVQIALLNTSCPLNLILARNVKMTNV